MWVALAACSRNGSRSGVLGEHTGWEVSSRASRLLRSGILCKYVQLFVHHRAVRPPAGRVDSCDCRLRAGIGVGATVVAYVPRVTRDMVGRRVYRDDADMVHVVVPVGNGNRR